MFLSPETGPAILSALAKGQFRGEGSYAAVWEYRGAALKLTRDAATSTMAQMLVETGVPGLPVIHSVTLDIGYEEGSHYDAVFMEILKPISERKFAELEEAYARARTRAVTRYKRIRRQSIAVARFMAEEIARIRDRQLSQANRDALVTGLCWLADFMESNGFCADFGNRRNWMVNTEGAVVIADPVVARIRKLDAEGSLGTPLSW